MQTLTPVRTEERIVFMDVLRGFAILGIFIANLGTGFSWYNESAKLSGPWLLPDADHNMLFLHHMLLEGKFYSIFSLLFGWGIALQVQKGIDKGISALPTIRRRLCIMLLLGAVHLLIWPGDIVFFYALLGFLLLPLRKLSDKALLITGCILILLPVLLYAAKMYWQWLNAPAFALYDTGMQVDNYLNGTTSEEGFMNLMRHGDWWSVFKSDLSGFFFRYGDLFFQSRIPKVLGMFLVGYALGRSNFYKNIQQHKKTLYYTIAFGLVVGLPANYLLSQSMFLHSRDYYDLKINGFYRTVYYAIGVAPLAMAYVAMFMLWFQTGMGKKLSSFLAPVGKMAFSNYMLQSLIGNFVFLGAGLGYMEKVGPVYYTLFGVIIFAGQVILSTYWLKYFNYGPVEWIWRSATYKKWQPFRKKNLK
ncbi:MAG: DUF418 domain-containing protein [Ferruginibacter sp.]